MKQSRTKYTFLPTSKPQFWSNLKYVLQSDRWCLDVGKNPYYTINNLLILKYYLCNTTKLQRKKSQKLNKILSMEKCLQTDL